MNSESKFLYIFLAFSKEALKMFAASINHQFAKGTGTLETPGALLTGCQISLIFQMKKLKPSAVKMVITIGSIKG